MTAEADHHAAGRPNANEHFADSNAIRPINVATGEKEVQSQPQSQPQSQSQSQSQSHDSGVEVDNAPKDPEKREPQHDTPEEQHGQGEPEKKGPAGGYDSTPIPYAPPGYTIKVTIHSAHNLPMADLNSLSSDPYVVAEIKTDNPTRHKEDPPLRMRTPTIRRSTDPEWNTQWTVANAPASGFKLKLRVYDEDPADKDDRLGNVHVDVPSVSETWGGIYKKMYDIEKKTGSKRAYMIRAVATCFRVARHMHGNLVLSIAVLGKTPEDGQNGRLYTLGPQWWTKHYSPLLGRIANTHQSDDDETNNEQGRASASTSAREKPTARRYDFQANQMQLRGPVPPQLYHRYVEFKPWTKRMFTNSGIQGFILSKALHHQHARVYNFDRSTQWGYFDGNVNTEVTNQFLDLVRWDHGARIFTYVLTLDALFRFTETGKEFGIDMLSKHTMHSDVSIYIAFSGEFFIRRLKHPKKPPPPEPTEPSSQQRDSRVEENPSHPPATLEGGPPSEDGPRDPSYYELVIDNDSGTYRPNAALLPILKNFLSGNFPGLHILTLDCNKDSEKMNKMKLEQRERKKKEGDHVVYRQGSRSSSISSSDEEDLDEVEAGINQDDNPQHEHGPFGQYARDRKLMQQAKWNKIKRDYGGKSRSGASSRPESNVAGGGPAPGESAA